MFSQLNKHTSTLKNLKHNSVKSHEEKQEC
jgi:hypothetical protein